MKKRRIIWFVVLIASYIFNMVTTIVYATTKSSAYTISSQYQPKAAMVIDADKGRVLYAENDNKIVDIASISKLMTAYLVYDAIKQGQINMDTAVVATKTDAAISQIKGLANTTIISGQSYRVKDLLNMQLLPSSNVASIMLANLVSNNQLDQFVAKMNAKAKEWGMLNTTFTHPSGASSNLFNGLSNVPGITNTAQNSSTAHDVLILSYQLIKAYPEILNITKLTEYTVGKETIKTTNASLPGEKFGLQGVDGLKTGSSGQDGYSYVFTMTKNNFRIIGVVLGVGQFGDERAKDSRHIIGQSIVDYIYTNYSIQTIIAKGTYKVEDSEVTFNENFNNLVGLNQNWQYKLENGDVVLQETLNSIIAPTTYRLSKESLTIKNKTILNINTILLICGIIIVLIISYFVLIKTRRRKRR